MKPVKRILLLAFALSMCVGMAEAQPPKGSTLYRLMAHDWKNNGRRSHYIMKFTLTRLYVDIKSGKTRVKFGMDFYLSDKVEYTFDSLKVGKIYKGGYIIESLSNVRASAVSILEFDGKKLVALSLPEEGNVYVGSGPMTFSKFNYGRVPDKKLYEKEIIRPRSLRLKLAKIERERNIEIQSQSSKP